MLLASLMAVGWIDAVQAVETRQDPPGFLIEVDPLPYLLGGAGAHLGISPQRWQRWDMGLSIVIGPELPQFVVERRVENRDKGFEVKINQGMGAWIHYRLSPLPSGWFLGVQIFTQELALSRRDVPDETNRTNLGLLALQAGYRWFPFGGERGFYLRPWIGGGHQWVVRGSFEPGEVTPDTTVGGEEYVLDRWLPFAALHLGWSF